MALISFPSSSSSSNTCQFNFKHDVFLSFRGEDTRYNFTSHLHKALRDKQIQTFIDYKLNRGDEISPSLLKAIEESKISVIIFSKDYASSGWCLEELVKILECKKSYGQIVIPVFYNVVPSDVRKQTGTFGDAFTKHEERFKKSLDKVQIWKDALKEAADLSGWHPSIITDESLLIENIVRDISKKLNDMSSSDSKGLVGIDTKIEQIVSLLGREDVHSVGIWGIGGIGKTTLAEVVFNRISCQFDGSYFIPNIRKRSEQNGGLNHLQGELLSTVLEDGNLNIGTAIVRRTFIRNRLGCKKLLIVFDDVTDFRQIKTLIGGFDCLNSQSRIIITTRDRRVLRNCGVDQVYEVPKLFHHEALELFHRHALKKNHPGEDYMELSKRVCEYTGGVPLALEVLSSFMCDRRKQEWVSALSKLERIANADIQQVLKISYDGLDEEEKNIFLDIACFFKGKNKNFVINFLNASGFSAEIGISVLSDKSLISLSRDKSTGNMIITMHDLLQEMAREIVRQECKEPGKRSRLWNYDDIYHVLTKGKGTEMIEAISLDMSSSNAKDINLTPRAFVKMEKLRLLEFYVSNVQDNRGNKVHVPDEGSEFVFNELKYLHWYGFPLKSFQPNFQSENLVILEIPNSNIEELWSGFPPPVNLKRIDLKRSKQLTSIPNCSGLKSLKKFDVSHCSKLKRLPELPDNLETLGIAGCESLVEIPSSFKYLNKVKYLYIGGCESLSSIPDLRGWKSLKKLNVWRCSKLKMLPEVPNNIESLYLSETLIEEFPPSFEDLHSLKYLDLTDCSMLKSLPSSICKSKSLESLCLHNCSKIDKLPDNIGTLESLKLINARGTAIREIPPSISCLKRLRELDLAGCKGEDGVGLILPPLSGLDNLWELNLDDCRIKEIPPSISCLKSLDCLHLSRCKGEDGVGLILPPLSGLDNLKYLNLGDCRIKEIPLSISYSKGFEYFDLSGCKGEDGVGLILPSLSGLDNLQHLNLSGRRIKEIPPSISCLKRLEHFDLSRCKGEDGVGLILPPLSGLDNLMHLNLSDCRIKELPLSISCLKRLVSLDLSGCKSEDGLGLILPPLSGIWNLMFLYLSDCRIKELSLSISCLKRLASLDLSGYKGEDGVGLILPPLSVLDNLRYLYLSDCGIKELPDSLGCLTSLESLNLAKNNFESIPGSIINLSKPWLNIDISNCERIKVLPKLQNWLRISAVNCTSLEELPSPSFLSTVADFTNCFKLNRNLLNYFLEGTVLQMQRRLSIAKRHHEVFGKGIFPAKICYPENDIPEWFSFRSTGSFIDVKLPQHCFNYNFIWLALSVVVTISDPDHQCDHQEDNCHKHSIVRYEHIVKSKDGDQCFNRINHPFYLFQMPYCGPDCIKSNHVVIEFGYCFDRELCDDEFSFRFYVKDKEEPNKKHIEVIKCGVHLMLGFNLETFGDNAPQEIKTYRITARDQGLSVMKYLYNLSIRENIPCFTKSDRK